MSEALATYRTASEAGDIDAVMSTLAPDAELISPVSGKFVFRGADDLRILLSAVYAGLKGLRWDDPIGSGDVRVLVGTAKIGPVNLGDAMVFELAPDGRIQRIRPHLRPWLAVTATAIMLLPKLMRHPGVVLRAMRG
jgi:hypothetical protein